MVQPASFLVFRELIGTAKHVINHTPEFIAEKYNLHLEKSFDYHLGPYVFVGFQKGEFIFGFLRYLDSPKQNISEVSVIKDPDYKDQSELSDEYKSALIGGALGLYSDEVIFLGNDT